MKMCTKVVEISLNMEILNMSFMVNTIMKEIPVRVRTWDAAYVKQSKIRHDSAERPATFKCYCLLLKVNQIQGRCQGVSRPHATT